MDKIYRRPTQLGNTPKKKKNEKNRVRNTFLNFRVTPNEKKLIETRVALTGLTKSEFFIQSCLYQTILVKGNIKTFSEIKDKILELNIALESNPNLENLEPCQIESLRIILEILEKISFKNKTKSQ